MEMKIQFIITGWHYNQSSLIESLILLKEKFSYIEVFYSCHKDPPEQVKNNFEWKLFPNLGMGDGGFQQAIDYLEIEENTICFFMQDDIIIKSLEFINKCIDFLNLGYKFIGNCQNYPTYIDPSQKIEKYNKNFLEFSKKNSRHLYDTPLNCKTLRGSFICAQYKSIKTIYGFEPIFHIPEIIQPFQNKKGKYITKGEKGIGGVGNLILNLFSYKINKVFGAGSITYLSNKYLDSEYIYECARGQIDNNNPIT